MEKCKKQNTYLIGEIEINANITNATLACSDLENKDQRWIGVVRDQYNKIDEGNICIQYIFFSLALDYYNLTLSKKNHLLGTSLL